jgi:hypothetical protein
MALRPDSAEFTRLILQIERELISLAQLRTLATETDAGGADNRKEAPAVKARLRRYSTTPGRFAIDC